MFGIAINFKKIVAAAAAFAVACSAAFAVPAMRGVRTVSQPDGTTIEICVVGDELIHFTATPAGQLLAPDADGFYRPAVIDATGAAVPAALAGQKPVSIADIDLAQVKAKRMAASRRLAPQSGIGLVSSTYPTVGSPKGLIILVEYSDVKFNSAYDPKEYFEDMINGANFTQYGATGSALQYFEDQSGGKFTPDFDVLGPVTLPNTRSYYGQNDRYGNDLHPEQMVTHAIDILNPTVDFSVYDTDRDGLIDNVYVFYAGQGEASYGSANTVWPHSWDVRAAGVNKRVDGVLVGHYACSNEWESSRPDGIGTFVHEFSHVMGLPDLYHTTQSGANYTPGSYSVLDYGPYNNSGRTPPNYSAYEKNAMGWYEPIMLDGPMSVELSDISSGEFGLIPASKATEFFLLENRQLTGWDKYIPNHGMLIWHIDYNKSAFEGNVVNNTKSHQYVDIVEANNSPGNEAGYTFPGTTGKIDFTASTSPALKAWSGEAIDLPIEFIAENKGIISFDVAGGAITLGTAAPFISESSESSRYFIAEWDEVADATEYFISVFADTDGAQEYISTGFDGSKMPSGWRASAIDWYTSTSNYGAASPSYKFDTNNQTLTSPAINGTVDRIEFWIKGQSSSNTYLSVEGLADGEWVDIADVTPQSNKATTVVLDTEIPANVGQVNFVMHKSTGNIAIDDIVISYGAASAVLPDYNELAVGNILQCKVDRLKEGVSNYHFTVTASDGKHTTTSAPVYVALSGEFTAASPSIGLAEDNPLYYNLQGIPISNPQPGQIVIERTQAGARAVRL